MMINTWNFASFARCVAIAALPMIALDSVGHGASADKTSEMSDWPTYRHDMHRSGYTASKIDAPSLGIAWRWRSAHPPQPAWHGPAKQDAYANVRDLPAMRNYDPVFHPIVGGDSVFFGSSADDTVYCLEAKSGKQKWTYVTDGPVRVAPTLVDGRIYVGSDDGFVYCLDAEDGSLAWKYSPVPKAKKILNNGRLISLWPCRTGVVVDGQTAYFASSMLPWKPSYVCAVDAQTGDPDGLGRYALAVDKMTMEGPFAVSTKFLISPQGRVAPQLFRRSDGKSLGNLKGSGGGSVVVLSLDANIYHGPAATSARTGGINASSPDSREKLASYGQGKDIVIERSRAYMLTRDALVASQWVDQKQLWTAPCEGAVSLIATANAVFVGGVDEVCAYSADSGELIWRHAVDGKAHGLAAARGQLLVSTDVGAIYAFRSGHAEWKPTPVAEDNTPPANVGHSPDPVADIHDDHLVSQWVFQSDSVTGSVVKDRAGKHNGTVRGQVRWARIGQHQALDLDGTSDSVMVADDHNTAQLPRRQISAEAWVRVDKPLVWGGIVGVLQDDGALERGWLLGINDQKFSFAVNATGGPDSLTYLAANSDFTLGGWYHVVGTFDGNEQKLYVNGQLAARDTRQQGDIKYPDKAFFEIGAYHDKDEYFRLDGMIHEVCLYDRVLASEEIGVRYKARKDSFPAAPEPPASHVRLAVGPWLQFTAPGKAIVQWHTSEPSPTILRYWLGDETTSAIAVEDSAPKTQHRVTLEQLKKDRKYSYVIQQRVNGQLTPSRTYECDTFFDYSVAAAPDVPSPFDASADKTNYRATADHLLSTTGVTDGICIVAGCGQGRLAYELARRSRLRVIGFDTDSEKVRQARDTLRQAKLYGGRVTVHHVEDYTQMNVPGEMANLVVSGNVLADGDLLGSVGEIQRLLKPGRGVALIGPVPDTAPVKDSLQQWLADTAGQSSLVRSGHDRWLLLRRDRLPGAGEWSHLYGRADNSAFGGEHLAGARNADEMVVQWVGRPGPRYQPDRNGRKPSPLATNGRLFLQGQQRLIGLDTCNGTILWCLEISGIERFNMPRDCSNWCASDDHVYAAIRDKCWSIDAKTGQVDGFYDAILAGNGDCDWGYISSQEGRILGSAVFPDTAWTDFSGGEGWYDAKSGIRTAKICSENLFALKKGSGNLDWTYADGLIINPTITIAAKRVYFIESRNEKVKRLPTRRIDSAELWNNLCLVSLDLETGKTLWERSIEPVPGIVTFHLAYGDEKLVLVSSADNKYHTYVYNAASGDDVWTKSLPWLSDNHGGHMSRPAIVDGTLYVRPHVFDLAKGALLPTKMPGGGCGTYACTTSALIFRSSTVTVWNRHLGTSSDWTRLRPDCWLSTIPAEGMLLSPEGGGGCSCGSWMETSVVFKPDVLSTEAD